MALKINGKTLLDKDVRKLKNQKNKKIKKLGSNEFGVGSKIRFIRDLFLYEGKIIEKIDQINFKVQVINQNIHLPNNQEIFTISKKFLKFTK